MTETWLRQFDALATADEPEWLRPVRRGAMDRFAQTGFPAARDEEWRFTPVTAITQAEFTPATPPSGITREAIAPFVFGHAEWPLLVFVDGRFDAALSSVPALPGGARAMSLAEAIAAGDATVARHLGHHAPVEASGFTALNTAFIRDGAFVHVPAGIELASPVHALFVSSGETEGTVAHPRNLIVIEGAARASVVESYVALAPGRRYFTNAVTEVSSGEGAWTEHTRIQRESESAYHVGLTT